MIPVLLTQPRVAATDIFPEQIARGQTSRAMMTVEMLRSSHSRGYEMALKR